MAPRKSERLVNLTICLLATRSYLTRERIRQAVEGYHDLSDAAFERTFERDKDELRAMGVPVETGTNDRYFDDEVGYRIARGSFELPPVSFTPDELSALGAATRVWHEASAASATASALAKLRAAGVEPDLNRLAAIEPSITADEPAFDLIWSATLERRRVGFEYRGGRRRDVEPWSVTWRKGRWYVLGRDVALDEPRMFKISRITGVPEVAAHSGGYVVPPDLDLAALARSLEPGEPDATATVAILADHAPQLRRRGVPVDSPVALPSGYVAYEVPYARQGDLVGDICAGAPDVLPLSPPDLRDAVVARLRGVVGVVADEGSGS